MVTSTDSGSLRRWYVNGLPQRPQNVRTTSGEDRKLCGSCPRKRNWLASALTHATAGAEAAFLQLRQWHTPGDDGDPLIR